jgi:type IV pilus assembly protein PilB
MSSYGFVGDLLIRKGLIDAVGLLRAVEAQAANPATLGRALARLGLADESVVAVETASALHLAFLEYDDNQPPQIDAKVVAMLPAEFCKKRGVLPLALEGSGLKVAVIDPLDDSALQDVKFRTGKKITAVVVTQTGFERLYARLHPEKTREVAYDMLATADPSGEVELTNEDEYELVDPEKLAKGVQLPPIIRLVNLILSDAASAGASDVHIEPQEKCLQVRHRVDGMLRDVLTIPHHLQDQTISRFKIMSGMDIAERRKPQDGRSRLRFEGRRIELRVSTLPTQFGEKVVIRLLNSDRAILPIDQINFAPHPLRAMKGFLARPQGMILVTGPTGSGKTSTLYTALNSIKSSSNNIITLEDPIEFQLPGVNQTQINTKAGVTFANGLRSILRQDPNVILVGEIRDHETAEIAMQAALTGHLLLSTLHTNDAPGTITRLIDLGIAPFLVASSLLGIVAQRLVRRPCPDCAVAHHPDEELLEKIGGAARLRADGKYVVGQGCPKCAGSGTKGRLAIHEMLEINNEVRDLITSRGSEGAIRKAARRNGMRTLFEDGLEKAAQGLTTIEEVLRVVSRDEPLEGDGQEAGPAVHAASPVIVVSPIAVAPPVAVVPPVAPAPVVVAAAPQDPAATDQGAPDPNARPRRVLVVEDSHTIASVVKYFLELEGFDVLLADNGRKGLAKALLERPDVIVSDVHMPDMGGLEMVRTIRADPALADVRILMLTSEASVDFEAEGFAAGADDYILKPVEPRRLAARVKALLARSRSRAA